MSLTELPSPTIPRSTVLFLPSTSTGLASSILAATTDDPRTIPFPPDPSPAEPLFTDIILSEAPVVSLTFDSVFGGSTLASDATGAILATFPSASTRIPTCGGCYGVATVNEVLIGSISTGKQIAISATVRLGEFSWSLAKSISIITDAGIYPQNVVYPINSIIFYNGTQFFNATMANVFQSYQLVAENARGSTCMASFRNFSLPNPLSIAIPTGIGKDAIFMAETSFVSQLPQATCTTKENGDSDFVLPDTVWTSDHSATNNHLSARIAVVVAISIIGVVIGTLLVLFVRRFRAKRLKMFASIAELPATRSKLVREMFAGGFAWQAELEANSCPQELPTKRKSQLE